MNYALPSGAESEILVRPETKPLDLRGMLELVSLIRPSGPASAYGELKRYNQGVLVTNGRNFVGKVCLVRFDLEDDLAYGPPNIETVLSADDKPYLPRGNFISSTIPFGLEKRLQEGLKPEEYVLYARWREKMLRSGIYPSLDDVNHYYDPGEIGQFAYIKGNDETEQKIVLINYWNLNEVERYSTVAEILPNPWERSRVMIAESKRRIKQLIRDIIEEGLVPIRLEELRHLPDSSNPKT